MTATPSPSARNLHRAVQERNPLYLDGYIKVFMQNRVSCVVFVAAGCAVGILGGAVEGKRVSRSVIAPFPIQQRNFLRRQPVHAMRIKYKK